MRVLVVDDDPDFRMMLRLQLEIAHHIDVVGEAGDGREALDFLTHTVPDAVVLDLMMPGMDGYETVERLRDEHASLPVVAYSAVTSSRAQQYCSRFGIPLLRKSGDTIPLVAALAELQP